VAKTYKHLFFDLDHTLWDFDRNSRVTMERVYQEFALKELGIDDFEAMFASYNVHNDRLWERYRNKYIKREELRWKRMWLMLLDFKIADTALAHEISMAYLEILPTQTLLVPNAKEVLDHCKGRYEMHLITNGFETTQRLKLQYSGIARYFTHLITSEKSNSMKPHKDIFDHAMRMADTNTDECIMIGDAVDIDIMGAINAGMDSVYYNPAGTPHKYRPTYEITDLKQLLTIL
jgi:putative hydrolase of the HAD superfamily